MKPQKWLIEFAVIIAIVLLIRATLVQAFNIPSASMQPTLLIGDFILVNKLVYKLSEPRRGI
ncbi:MAG: S26 family signal peptidase [Aquificota bacterium]|nr:S26 family signal peptidase [Aquificota bacterium]